MQQSAARFLNAAGGALIWFFMRSGQPADGGDGFIYMVLPVRLRSGE